MWHFIVVAVWIAVLLVLLAKYGFRKVWSVCAAVTAMAAAASWMIVYFGK